MLAPLHANATHNSSRKRGALRQTHEHQQQQKTSASNANSDCMNNPTRKIAGFTFTQCKHNARNAKKICLNTRRLNASQHNKCCCALQIRSAAPPAGQQPPKSAAHAFKRYTYSHNIYAYAHIFTLKPHSNTSPYKSHTAHPPRPPPTWNIPLRLRRNAGPQRGNVISTSSIVAEHRSNTPTPPENQHERRQAREPWIVGTLSYITLRIACRCLVVMSLPLTLSSAYVGPGKVADG